MVPLRDENPTKIVPYITYVFIVINSIIFLYQWSLTPVNLERFYHVYAIIPSELNTVLDGSNLLASSQNFPEIYTLISSQFLHGGWLHLGGNMLFLWVFGNNIEDQLGHFKYILFYLGCGILAGISQFLFSMDSSIPCLGASGAIAGVMGAYIIRFPKAQILTLVPLGFFITALRLPAFLFLGLWFVQQAIASVYSLNLPDSGGGVAYWAHAGGFVFGALLGPPLGLFASKRNQA